MPDPEPEEAEEAEQLPQMATGNEMLDGILLHSQQRMLEAIGRLQERVNQPFPVKPDGEGSSNPVPPDMITRLARIESTHAGLTKSLNGLHSAMRKLKVNLAERGTWEMDVLLHIQQQFYGEDAEEEEPEEEEVSAAEAVGVEGILGSLGLPTWLGLGILGVAGGLGYRRYRAKRARNTKIL